MIINYLKSNEQFKNFYSFFFKNGEKIFCRKNLFQKKFQETINRESFEFKTAGIEIKEIEKNIDPKINSVLGWVPYIKDKTSVTVYNFFSTNYSIRKQFILRLTLIKKLDIILQKTFLFPAFSIEDFDLRKIFKNLDGDTVFIELFNPNIRKNHGGADGHLRAWGNYHENNECYNATVHSARLPMDKKFSSKFFVTRNFSPSTDSAICFNSSIGISKKRNILERVHYGYNLMLDNNNFPRAIWHHSHTPYKKVELKQNHFNSVQSFWCPDLDGLDPNIFIDSIETGVSGENEIKIFIMKDNKITNKKKVRFKENLNLPLSEIFNEEIKGPYICLISFKHNFSNKYIHMNYNVRHNNKVIIGDCVHSLDSNLLIDENDQPLSKIIEKQSNALKFMHFSKLSEKENYFLLVHVPKLKNFSKQELKIRIHTDEKYEYILKEVLDPEKKINVFDLKKILKEKNIQLFMKSKGIIQIESPVYNYPGYLMKVNKINKSVAIDHLTGG